MKQLQQVNTAMLERTYEWDPLEALIMDLDSTNAATYGHQLRKAMSERDANYNFRYCRVRRRFFLVLD